MNPLLAHTLHHILLCGIFLIIWWNIDRDIGKVLQGSNFKSQHLFIVESSAWTLMSVQEYGAIVTLVLLRAHGAMAPYSWMLIRTHGHSWALVSTHEFYLVLMRAHKYSWMLKSAHERSLVPMSAHSATLMSAYGCSWLIITTHQQCNLMGMAPWRQQN